MTRRYARVYRCMFRVVRGREHNGPGRKCWAQVTTEPHKLGRCPKCGCDWAWADITPGRERIRARETCNDGRCIYGHPHSIYSRECVNNPNRAAIDAALKDARDPFGMTDEPGRVETEEEPSW